VLLDLKFATERDPNNVANFKSSTLAWIAEARRDGRNEGG
jgi:hypothetical protein